MILEAIETVTEDARLEELLSLMGAGDADGLRQFVDDFDDSLRRRIGARVRKRFGASAAAGSDGVDQDELFAEVLRRLFSLVRTSRLRARRACEFWSLVGTIIDHAAIDQTRSRCRCENLARASAEQMRWAPEPTAAEATGRECLIELNDVMDALTNESDRELLRMWYRGMPWNVAAEQLGVTPACVRKRWEHVRKTLRARLVGATVN